MPELLPDVLQLVFQQLAGDNASLLNVSLTCRAWRSLALPSVFQVVDISSHNNGRQPQLECSVRPLVYADYCGSYRPKNLVPRQRAFLQLMTDKPQLARYVKSFTWTLIWWDFDEVYTDSELEEIDKETWTVFGRMVNVTHLDLASLHNVVGEDGYIRHQTPPTLFPKVKDLRLLGWMHRGLVRAIITSLEPSKLENLKLDYLEDEGALPNGDAIGDDIVTQHSHSSHRGLRGTTRLSPEATDGSEIFHNDLIVRQETGKAFIFPGPMWLPLHLLLPHAMPSLTCVQVKVPPWNRNVDLRNYNTLFRHTSMFIAKTKETLKSLTIVLAVSRGLWETPGQYQLCGTGRAHRHSVLRPWSLKMARLFLEQLLGALNDNAFPRLEELRFEGFQLLHDANDREAARAELAGVLQLAQETCCRFADINATLTDIPSVQARECFDGYDGGKEREAEFAHLLASS